MTKLRMFRGMTQNERTSALEAVIAGKLHLFVLIPKTGNCIVPKNFIRIKHIDREKYVYQGGFLKFKDGKAAALNVFARVGRIETTLLDEEGIEVKHVRCVGLYGVELYDGLERVEFSLNNDLLAVDDLLPEEKMKQFSIPTPEFAALQAVYGKYWASGKDGQTKENIVDWIRAEFGFSKKTAEVIDTICRPEDRRIGGNVKLKRV